MAIDYKKLINGESVLCPTCGKGHLQSDTGEPANRAKRFVCDYCKEKTILNVKMKKPSE